MNRRTYPNAFRSQRRLATVFPLLAGVLCLARLFVECALPDTPYDRLRAVAMRLGRTAFTSTNQLGNLLIRWMKTAGRKFLPQQRGQIPGPSIRRRTVAR